MKKLLLILLLFGVGGIARGQTDRLWATYYGGSGVEFGLDCTTDFLGNVYITGFTSSTSSIAYNGFQNTFGGEYDAFLVKFDSLGNRLWATYYGGTSGEHSAYVTTDIDGNVYLAGTTNSTNGIASGGFQNTISSASGEAFLVKFDANGNRLWATYYGGINTEVASAVTTDIMGNVYLAGNTNSTSEIASGGFQNALGGNNDAFLVKFDASGNRLWATYYGGTGEEYGYGVATDLFGNVLLTGITLSTSAIASGGFQNTFGGMTDAFLVKFDTNGNRLWATYYGGEDEDSGYDIVTDISRNIYLVGNTYSLSDIASNGFQNTFGGLTDAFLVKFDSNGNRIWATYYGGEHIEEGLSATIDVFGNIYLGGDSYSTAGVALNGFQNDLLGTENEFIATFDSAGNPYCATYFGIVHDENGYIAADNFGNVYLAGTTYSEYFIAHNGFQNTYGGSGDVYLAKFSTCGNKTIIEPDSEIEIPNFVTPNNDNQNDHFEIKNLLIGDTKNALTIFNRWGNKIYETDNYLNNWNGDKHSAGTYFYILTHPDGTTSKGTITLIK
ncbi:MAG: gliding motility-associated C-terminal domain-containing protein [Bacteroidia bacterium]